VFVFCTVLLLHLASVPPELGKSTYRGRWVPCHHDTAHPQVADGGDGLQICRVAATESNKQLLTADKGWSSILGVGRGAYNTSTKK
jgi:hypothetical protein